MSAAHVDLEFLKVPREKLFKDQTYAIERMRLLTNASASDDTSAEKIFSESVYLSAKGEIKYYKMSFNLRFRSEVVGHDIDDVTVIDIARR